MPLEMTEMKDLRVELKVCEGCGALWLRAGNSSDVYCRRCVGIVADLPVRKRLRTPKPLIPTASACAGGAR